MRNKNGFTLLELLVVIFIVSLLTALVFPSFYSLAGKGLKLDAQRVASLLRYINDSAVSTKENCLIRFGINDQKISWKCLNEEKEESLEKLSAVELQSKGIVRDGEVIVFFDSSGIKENIAVHLADGDKKMVITLNQLSGRVKISENPK